MGLRYRLKDTRVLFFVFIFVCIGAPTLLLEERFEVFHQEPTHLVFVGDIMLSRQIGEIIDSRGPLFPFEKVKDVISKADIAFANLENPVSVRGADQGSIYSFRAKPEVIQGLVYAGFDLVSIANNHMFDWGAEAFVDTMNHLNSYGIDFVGGGLNQEEAYEFKKFTQHGETFCFLGFTEFAPRSPNRDIPGMAYLNQEKVIERIKEIKQRGCDTVGVSIHWGNEYETKASFRQQILARSFIDAGALLVIGHHPHVLQEIEEYNGGLIAYSLGNFIFDQNFSEDTQKSLVLNVFVDRGKVVSFSSIPIRFTREFQPYAVEEI